VDGIIKWVWENHDPLASSKAKLSCGGCQFDTEEFLEAKMQCLRDYQTRLANEPSGPCMARQRVLPTTTRKKTSSTSNADDRERFQAEVHEVLFDTNQSHCWNGSEGLRHTKLQPLWEDKQGISKSPRSNRPRLQQRDGGSRSRRRKGLLRQSKMNRK